MQKEEIVSSLREMADLLEITDANKFEYLAIRGGAQGIEDWHGDLHQAVASSSLTDIPSVGKGIAQVVADLIQSGRSEELDRVRGLVPAELPRLLRFRGLGPKRVRTLWTELGIESPADLERCAQQGLVQELKGFGVKTVEKILSSVEYFRQNPPMANAPRRKLDNTIPVASTSSGRICAGTSGYSYPQWKDNFYPQDARNEELLKHYAQQLETVEINNTFYRFPSETVVEQWMSQTPDDFQFALKAHRRVTHQMRLSAATRVRIHEFVDRCSVLGSRLGCILFQLPPDFARDDSRLDTLLESLPEGPRFAVEFRHESWLNDEIHARLREHNVACVCGDAEDRPPSQYVTADFVYARLRRPSYTKTELDMWDHWFKSQQSHQRDVLVYLKHDDTPAAPNAIVARWKNQPAK